MIEEYEDCPDTLPEHPGPFPENIYRKGFFLALKDAVFPLSEPKLREYNQEKKRRELLVAQETETETDTSKPGAGNINMTANVSSVTDMNDGNSSAFASTRAAQRHVAIATSTTSSSPTRKPSRTSVNGGGEPKKKK